MGWKESIETSLICFCGLVARSPKHHSTSLSVQSSPTSFFPWRCAFFPPLWIQCLHYLRFFSTVERSRFLQSPCHGDSSASLNAALSNDPTHISVAKSIIYASKKTKLLQEPGETNQFINMHFFIPRLIPNIQQINQTDRRSFLLFFFNPKNW